MVPVGTTSPGLPATNAGVMAVVPELAGTGSGLMGFQQYVCAAIFAQDGTLVGYRGDGLLAVFGAPIALDDHADRALAAAREMLEVRLPRFNDWLAERRLSEPFEMGIGLNSGPFMSGNVGSAKQLEYTVHGDTVNTASRLEGMTKRVGRSLLIAESTRRALSEPPNDLEFVGEHEVRGRQSTISLWTLQGTRSRDRSPIGPINSRAGS